MEAAAGQRLLDVAWAAREPLEGACEGVMACSTCHVIVDAEDFEKLPPASEEEEDLLDLAAHATRTSRLACQIMLTPRMRTPDRANSAGGEELDGPLTAESADGSSAAGSPSAGRLCGSRWTSGGFTPERMLCACEAAAASRIDLEPGDGSSPSA